MEPVTHALTSLALGRAGLDRATRFALPMLLVSGLAADLDWLSYCAGPRIFLAAHRTASHSFVGAAVIAASTAGLFFWLACHWPLHAPADHRASSAGNLPGQRAVPFRFWPALVICGSGAGAHLLLDLTNSYGIQLLWPFSAKWYGWDIAGPIDPFILALLLAAVLLPLLLRLVMHEISGRTSAQAGGRGPMAALLLVALYLGGREVLHHRALALLNSRLYRGEAALRSAAFPRWSPLDWSGLVDTKDALEEVSVPVYPAGAFNPDQARHLFKPADSPALQNALHSPAAQAFLAFARFPFAIQETTSRGYEIRIQDLRFVDLRLVNSRFALSAGRQNPASVGEVVAVINVNEQGEVTDDALQFAGQVNIGAGILTR